MPRIVRGALTIIFVTALLLNALLPSSMLWARSAQAATEAPHPASLALGENVPEHPGRAAAGLAPGASSGYGTPVIDGVIDAVYGTPLASDPAGDGNGNANMDLLNLHVAEDASNYYFAFTVNANLSTVNWGKYMLYIDTTNDANGATSDAWGRNVTVSAPHKPEFSINSWVDAAPYGTDDVQLQVWNQAGSSWSSPGTIAGAAMGAGATSVIEWQVTKASLGNPGQIWVELWDTGGGGTDNAQDTINNPANDWNASDWTTQAILSVSTRVGPPIVDGVVDEVYGAPLASDPAGDGNGNANMDLLNLYVTEDASNYYVAFTVNADLAATNWGKYILYIDTTNDTNGATSDAWGRNVVVSNPHKPEFSVNTWLDAAPYGPEDVQLQVWGGSSWSSPGTIAGAALGTGTPSVIEWQISKASLGNPSQLWMEVWDTGGGGTDNAQDTINNPANDWNASDWTTQAVLANSTPYPPTAEPPGADHDNDIWWGDLGHNSRDPLYRTPGGAVPTNTPVKLRLRAASGDLTAARLRIWNDRLDSQYMLDMTRVADDGTYEWWEATAPASAQPTIYWYRFIAIDGTATAYYEDDSARTGGWGETFGSSPDQGWQLTIYDASFQTPDWVKNAVIYQIFPDRFRDGNPSNNTPAGSFFYNEPGGTTLRSGQSNWNQFVCDPRNASSACAGTYSKNFYGGDLQGITAKLDYLQQLGVTAIYLNPIFESPSNHKYDTTDFSVVDDNFGVPGNHAASLAVFQTLAQEAHNRGIKLILDGVFNHTSSDSIYFDRYMRYLTTGACESTSSPYRGWYYFQPAPTPGTGPCAGDTTYTSWFNYDSLPKLNASSTEVRNLIYAGGTSAIGRYWMQWADGWRLDVGGDVDPGVTNNPGNTFWEEFRDAVHLTKPDAYIVGEEWAVATPWTLGQEWDATMNYQFSSAVLSFWRSEPFSDNDHNSGSSAGILTPLKPSQLDERLHNLQERYPPEAFYAMMNLLGSHDTSRALFLLDHNTEQNNSALYANPNYDWSDAITRLKGVWLLQMTLPGAPTTYYGDEVGLVGPATYDGSQWQDDPYNRQPFPWLDQSGVPFYAHLQSQASQDALRAYYTLLTSTRNSHPALRTGSFDTLLADDTNMVYAYGRKLADNSDAAVVIANQTNTARTVSLDVSGYLPVGAQLADVLNGNALATVAGDGSLTVSNVPAMNGSLLVLTGTIAVAPAAVTNLAVVAERNAELVLSWTGVAGATSYDLYRSLVSGGGYTLVANVTGTTYTDTNLLNATRYYYVIVSRNDSTGLVSGYSNEASGVPHHDLSAAWYNLQWPHEITHTLSAVTPTVTIYGQLYIAGATGASGPATGIHAQVGYGPIGTMPSESWTWVEMSYRGASGNNDEYQGQLLPGALGEYLYTTRWSSDGGVTWNYTDRDGPPPEAGKFGLLHVVASADTVAPAAPLNLRVLGTTSGSISFAWDASTAPDLAGYEIYRQQVVAASSPAAFALLDTVGPTVTSYTDNNVTTGATYQYYVVAFDTSYNRSPVSNTIQATAEPRMVAVTFNVTVPSYTPGRVYIVGSLPEFGSWNPGAVAMTQTGPNTWSITLNLLDNTTGEFKFTRGNWETVEKQADGNAEVNNRPITVAYGLTGTQTVNLTIENWRDPLVVGQTPLAGATSVAVDTNLSVVWNQSMAPNSTLTLTGPNGAVTGTVSYSDTTRTLTFDPAFPLASNSTYTVTVSGQTDANGDVQQVPAQWTFTTGMPTAITIGALTGHSASPWLPLGVFGLALATGVVGLVWWRRRSSHT
jgi:glycosidase